MAHKKMKGRRTGMGTSVKKSLQQARRETTVKNKKGLKRKLLEDAAAEADATGAPKKVVAEGGPKLTKKETKAAAMAARQHHALYSDKERTLLVGEGNFSFARALCRHLGTGVGVFATCFDGEETLKKKYTDSAECRKEVEDQGGTTLVGVDATHLHSVKEFRRSFGTIVWNFPHIGGGETDLDKSAEEHRILLGKFFRSAAKCLDPENPEAAIHVALKSGEPYKSWRVVQMARGSAPLELRSVLPFAPGAWDGYAHRRTIGFKDHLSKDDSAEIAKGASIYVFVLRAENAE